MTHPDRLAERLEPCPFCGGTASTMKARGWSANCDNGVHGCDVSPETTEFGTEAGAIAAWNRRALATPVPGAVSDAMVERPICKLMADDGKPAWQQIVDLFHRCHVVDLPVRLRDELVVMLMWARYAEALEAAVQSPPTVGVPEFFPVARRKLDSLLADGWAINGYAIMKGEDRRGFVDFGGFVGWWLPEYYKGHTSDSSLAPVEAEATEPVAEWGAIPNVHTDDAHPINVLAGILLCAESWEPKARIIGNVRAGDIARAIRSFSPDALSAPTGDSGALREALAGGDDN